MQQTLLQHDFTCVAPVEDTEEVPADVRVTVSVISGATSFSGSLWNSRDILSSLPLLLGKSSFLQAGSGEKPASLHTLHLVLFFYFSIMIIIIILFIFFTGER